MPLENYCLGRFLRLRPKQTRTSPEVASNEGSNGGGLQRSELNVSEEYRKVFRTSSYTDIYTRVQAQMGTTSIAGSRLCPPFSPSHPPAPPLPLHVHLSDRLLEPGQDIVLDLIDKSGLHELLVDCFYAGLEAWNMCEVILRSIHATRANYRLVKRDTRSAGGINHDSWNYTEEQLQGIMLQNLTLFTSLANPLSRLSTNQFNGIRDRLVLLLDQLTLRHRRLKRRLKFVRLCKRATGTGLVVSSAVLTAVILVLAIHSILGIALGPGGLMSCFRLARSTMPCISNNATTLRRLSSQLDLAAKGIYILINDFDTMWTLAMKLHGDVEHTKVLADICVRNSLCQQVLKEGVRELNARKHALFEQLKELEEHVYLCFLTINRSRRLLVEKVI